MPTISESGYKNFESETWVGLVAPARTPNATLTQLSTWFGDALRAPEVNAKLAALGLRSIGTCGADFGNFLRKQHDDYSTVVREGNIKVE